LEFIDEGLGRGFLWVDGILDLEVGIKVVNVLVG
jgi:hypothetical protein